MGVGVVRVKSIASPVNRKEPRAMEALPSAGLAAM